MYIRIFQLLIVIWVCIEVLTISESNYKYKKKEKVKENKNIIWNDKLKLMRERH